jgi:hypothetical protein
MLSPTETADSDEPSEEPLRSGELVDFALTTLRAKQPGKGRNLKSAVVLLTATVALLPFLIGSFVAFTSLVKLEYGSHRPEWEADGRPGGLFWRAPTSGLWQALRSGFATNVLSLKWLFITPTWARADARSQQLLRRLRICVAVWNCGVVAAFIAAIAGLIPLPR